MFIIISLSLSLVLAVTTGEAGALLFYFYFIFMNHFKSNTGHVYFSLVKRSQNKAFILVVRAIKDV